MKRYNVAVVGATGAVGSEMIRLLGERRFPVRRLRLLASRRSQGRRIRANGTSVRVEALKPHSFEGIDLALFSAGAARSLEFAPKAVKQGAVVVDNSSAFRMAEEVPLVVPEVNPEALKEHNGIVANPNCSTIILLVALAPLHRAARIKRLIVSTYQSVSGAGAKAMAQLYNETKDLMRRARVSRGNFRVNPKIAARSSKSSAPLASQIAFNIIPQIDTFLDNLYTKEEMKMAHETRKILGEPRLSVSATCARVPVFVGHAQAAWIETERSLTVARARECLRKAPGVSLVDNPGARKYPLPIAAAGRDNVLVGRIRKDESVGSGLALWVAGDNLRKGAATNALQIAELLL